MQNPEGFYEFYKNKMMFLDAEPNPAHRKLAEMEQKGKLTAVSYTHLVSQTDWLYR